MKQWVGKFFLFCMLVFADGYLLAGKNQEKIRLMHADSLVSTQINKQDVTELFGNVKFEQDDAHLSCDKAQLWDKANLLILTGNVTIFDGKRYLTANRVHYFGQSKTEQASGNVTLTSGKRKLSSDFLKYEQENETAVATGRVVFTDFIEKVTLRGEQSFYDRKHDYGYVETRCQLVKVDTLSQDSVIVQGNRMEAWGDMQKVIITDSVRMMKNDLSAMCRKMEYYSGSDSLFLFEQPVVCYQNQEMKGNRIDIGLDGTRFQGGIVRGNALATSKDSTFEDVLKGNKIVVIARNDSLQQVLVEGQASSVYHIFDEDSVKQGVNLITGDYITLFFRDGQIEDIQVVSDPGQCMGVYTPEKRNGKKEPKEITK